MSENVHIEIAPNEVDKITEQVINKLQKGRKLIFFEVYVGQGSISKYLAKQFPDTEVSTFGLNCLIGASLIPMFVKASWI